MYFKVLGECVKIEMQSALINSDEVQQSNWISKFYTSVWFIALAIIQEE